MAITRRKDSGMGVDPVGYVPDYSPEIRPMMEAPTPSSAPAVVSPANQTPPSAPVATDSGMINRVKSFAQSPNLRRVQKAVSMVNSPLVNAPVVIGRAIANRVPIFRKSGAVGVVKSIGSDVADTGSAIKRGVVDAGTRLLFGQDGVSDNARVADADATLNEARSVAASQQPAYRVTGINAEASDYEPDGVQTEMTPVGYGSNIGDVSGVRVVRPGGVMRNYSSEQVGNIADSPSAPTPIARPVLADTATTNEQNAVALQRFNDFNSRTNANAERLLAPAIAREKERFAGPRDSMRPSKEERVAREVGATQRDVARIGAEAARYGLDRADANLDKTLRNRIDVQREANQAPSGKIDRRQSDGVLKRAEMATKRYNDLLDKDPTDVNDPDAELKHLRALRLADQEQRALWGEYDRLTGGGETGEATVSDNSGQGGKIRITRNGQSGTIDPKDFNPATDKRI